MNKVSRTGPRSLLLLRIELEHSSPAIWRSVLVPDNITLENGLPLTSAQPSIYLYWW